MMDFHMIIYCSTVDLPASYLMERGIPYSCPHSRMSGMEYDDDLGKSISIEGFYENIRQGAMSTTPQMNPEQYEVMFEPILKGGKGITHMTLSSGVSGTYNSAVIARDETLERYPDRWTAVINSCYVSTGYGLLVDTVWEKTQAGADHEEFVSWIEKNRKRVHHWFLTSDLIHLRRGGRISAPAAFFGNMLNICPLMNVNVEDRLIPRDKYRGKKRVIHEMMERMKEHAQQGIAYNDKCSLSQSFCPEDVGAVAGLVEKTFPRLNEKTFIVDIGIVVGPRISPGTICLAFWRDERTAWLASENHSLTCSH